MNAVEKIPEDFFESIHNLNIVFDEGDVQQLGKFIDLLLDTNRLFNLTAVKDHSEAWTKHILDSLSLIPLLTDEGVEHVIDIGSGGGLPGIPLAITMPQATFSLVESTKKKAVYLDQVVSQLGLDNVTVLAERAEHLATPEGGFRGIADAVIARAVGHLNVLLELTIPFVKVGGVLIAIKGKKTPQEIEEASKALQLLYATVEKTVRTSTGTIVVVRKLKATPKKYPRVAGEPKRSPLGTKGGNS